MPVLYWIFPQRCSTRYWRIRRFAGSVQLFSQWDSKLTQGQVRCQCPPSLVRDEQFLYYFRVEGSSCVAVERLDAGVSSTSDGIYDWIVLRIRFNSPLNWTPLLHSVLALTNSSIFYLFFGFEMNGRYYTLSMCIEINKYGWHILVVVVFE
jgi:hypothetical protein